MSYFVLSVENYPFIKIIKNPFNPRLNTLQCGLCHEHSGTFKIDPRGYGKMSLPAGDLRATEEENLAMIRAHVKSAQHQTVVSKLRQCTLEDLMDEVFQSNVGL